MSVKILDSYIIEKIIWLKLCKYMMRQFCLPTSSALCTFNKVRYILFDCERSRQS